MNIFNYSKADQGLLPKPAWRGKMFGAIPCYGDDQNAIWGVNPLCDWLISVACYAHNLLAELGLTSGGPFPIEIVEEYDAPKT